MDIQSKSDGGWFYRVALCIVGLLGIVWVYGSYARKKEVVGNRAKQQLDRVIQQELDARAQGQQEILASQNYGKEEERYGVRQDSLMDQSCHILTASSKTLPQQSADAAHNAQPVWLTVFVHGIMSVKPHLTINNFVRFLKDDVKDTYYEKSIAFMRENEFFYQNQAMGPLGLQYIDLKEGLPCIERIAAMIQVQELEKRDGGLDSESVEGNGYRYEWLGNSKKEAHCKKNMSSIALAYAFDQANELAGTHQHNNRYYTFGWSGLMSPRARYEDGKKLFEALEREVCDLRARNCDPKVRVVGYSHGGNVALNIGQAHRADYPDSSLVIDELVLLGTPIQYDTDYLINDAIFKRVYNIYSLSDRVQRLDFFSLNRLFSGRVFSARKDFKLPDKLVQIQLKVTALSKKKMRKKDEEFIRKRVEKTSDLKKRGVITGKSHLLVNVSPGHAELWAFGWTPQHYRSLYPLYPLPIVFMLPFITYNVQDYYDYNSRKHKLIVDIRPDHECILFRKRNKKTVEKIVPFIPREKLSLLRDTVAALAPENYTREEYERHTCDAIRQAHEVYGELYSPHGTKGSLAKRCRIK